MITKQERKRAIQHAWKLCKQTGVTLLDHEVDQIEVAGFLYKVLAACTDGYEPVFCQAWGEIEEKWG